MKIYSVLLFVIFAYVIWLFSASINQLELIGNQSEGLDLKSFYPEGNDFKFKYSKGEQALLDGGLIDVQQLNSNIHVALAYATKQNFTDSLLYKDIKRAFLQKFVAEKLNRAQQYLEVIDSSLALVVLDAARPQSVQHKLWEWAKRNNMTKYVASPWTGSNHNFGCAVDITIMAKDSLLDMGTQYDYFGRAAEPRFQWQLLEEGTLSQKQIDNRMLLKKVMRSAGFRPILTEWWHFNGLSKERAREYYRMIP